MFHLSNSLGETLENPAKTSTGSEVDPKSVTLLTESRGLERKKSYV